VIPLEEDDVEELEADAIEPVAEEELELLAAAAVEVFAELASPKAWSNAARKALAATPLFSALDHDTLEDLLTRIGLVSLEPGEVLFREGEPGDTLYIIAEGEVGVAREGPPRRAVARLGAGAFFGEVALITDQARTATVEAITATQLLAIDRALVSTLVADHPDVLFVILRFVRDRLLARLLDTSPMFAPMAPEDRTSLAARFQFLEIEPGAVIVEERTKTNALYVFLAGRADSRRGAELVRYLGAGDLAGEASLLRGGPSPVRIAAITRCLALSLAAADFREVIMTHPHVLEYVGELAERDAAGAPRVDFHLDLI
jgi:cAMP-dependent protein kinase regulator